jgi:phosphonate transport system permease protein
LVLTWPLVKSDSGFSGDQLGRFGAKFFSMPEAKIWPKLAVGMGETLLIAFVATFWAVLLAVIPAALAARGVGPSPLLAGTIRIVAAVIRSTPDLLLALMLASAIGLGPRPGAIALIIASLGFLIKNFADALEVVNRGPVEGLESTGAGWLGVRTLGVAPQAAPDFVGLSLYMLDVNLRASAILGAVGAGGIGYDLMQAVKFQYFDRLWPMMLAIALAVTMIDRLSSWVRERLA